MKLQLLEHQTFNVIKSFNNEPLERKIFDIISNKYNKKVIKFKRLDHENFLFTFNDESTIELLLREIEETCTCNVNFTNTFHNGKCIKCNNLV